MPWFVSDVTPADFAHTLEALLSPTFFSPAAAATGSSRGRSESRQRAFQASPAVLSGEARAAKGSGALQMSEEEIEERKKRGESPHPRGSRGLVMDAQGRTGEMEKPKGSMGLALDPSYFQRCVFRR